MVHAIEALSHRGMAVQADAADAEAVIKAVNQVAAEFGRLDILVNNAGLFLPSPIAEATMEAYDTMFNINVRGLYAATIAAAKHMGQGGRIINIGSVNADRLPFPGAAVYGATKAAVQGLTRGFARDLGPRGITINTIQPGPVDTDLNPDNSDFAAAAEGRHGDPALREGGRGCRDGRLSGRAGDGDGHRVDADDRRRVRRLSSARQ